MGYVAETRGALLALKQRPDPISHATLKPLENFGRHVGRSDGFDGSEGSDSPSPDGSPLSGESLEDDESPASPRSGSACSSDSAGSAEQAARKYSESKEDGPSSNAASCTPRVHPRIPVDTWDIFSVPRQCMMDCGATSPLVVRPHLHVPTA